MKKKCSITVMVISFIFAIYGASIAVAQGNTVNVQIEHDYNYNTSEDFINNEPLILSVYWLTNLFNRPDDGGLVVNPVIEWQTDLNFDLFNPEPTTSSDGYYKWDFTGINVEESEMVPISGYEENNTLIMRPRFNVSRSVEPKILADDTTQQIVTVTLKLEEELPEDMNSFWIDIGSPSIAYLGADLVESSFISQVPVAGWNASNNLFQCQWNIDPKNIEIGKTYTFMATLESTKSVDLVGSPIFTPSVWVFYGKWHQPNPSVVTSNSVTVSDLDGHLSATFTADNIVDWNLLFTDSLYIFRLLPVVSQITPPPPPFHVLIPADVTIKPETLNTKSNGKFTAFVQLPEPYNVADIDVSTVTCEGASAIKGTIVKGFHVLKLKFNRQDLNEIEPGESIEFTVTGELEDGSIFEGKDSIRVNK
jgi:hypothetical protein